MEVHEESTFISSKIVLFHADQQKRSRTVGPGSYMADPRSGVNGGIDYMTTTEDSTRGRRVRRESVHVDALQRPPLTALNGQAEPIQSAQSSFEQHSLRPVLGINMNTLRPVLGIDLNSAQRSSDPALYIPGPLAPSPAGMSQ